MVKVKTWAELLNTFCTTGKLELELMYKVQMQCYEDAKLMKLFPEIVRSLYDQDVLAEDTILHWFRKGTNSKGRYEIFSRHLSYYNKTSSPWGVWNLSFHYTYVTYCCLFGTGTGKPLWRRSNPLLIGWRRPKRRSKSGGGSGLGLKKLSCLAALVPLAKILACSLISSVLPSTNYLFNLCLCLTPSSCSRDISRCLCFPHATLICYTSALLYFEWLFQ